MDNVTDIIQEIWNELVVASAVESPLNIKPYYNEMVKVEDPTNAKVMVDFKLPSEMTLVEYKSLPAKNNWQSNIKYSLYSINRDDGDAPIRLCHLIMVTAYKLKVFGDDAFGKVSSRCKVGATVINRILEDNLIFFPAGAARSRLSVRARALNEETFKSCVVDILKVSSDTNLQRTYVGDGEGNMEIAGLGIPPIALTDGTVPGSEILFKRCLHEVKGLFESQQYLKNPLAPETVAARQQSAILESINRVVNGQPTTRQSNSTNASSISLDSIGTSSTTDNDNNTPSPSASNPAGGESSSDKKKRTSPAVAMAEASLLSQQAALKEASNFEALIAFQHEELSLRKDERNLGFEERKTQTLLMQKMVDRMCPELDPTEKFASRKRKLDELRDVLGEELYQAKVTQLREEYMKASAF
jgi:hypothetical protein